MYFWGRLFQTYHTLKENMNTMMQKTDEQEVKLLNADLLLVTKIFVYSRGMSFQGCKSDVLKPGMV